MIKAGNILTTKIQEWLKDITAMIHGGQGLSLSIAVDTATEIASLLNRTGKVFKAHFSIMLKEIEIPKRSLRHFVLKGKKGLFVSKIEGESPASRSQLLEGDIIVGFNGERIENIHELFKVLGNKEILRMVDMEVLRHDQKLLLPITPINRAA